MTIARRSEPSWLFVFGLCALSVLSAVIASTGECAEAEFPNWIVSFDTDLNASPSATNPYSASNLVQVVEVQGATGRAAYFAGTLSEAGHASPTPVEQQALIFSGENLPSRAGWIEFRLRLIERDHSRPHKRRWIVALPPVVGELHFGTMEVGLGLGLVQEENGDLVLALHRFKNGRLLPDYRLKGMQVGMAAPDATPIRFAASTTDAIRSWRRIRIGWDQAAAKVFLGVDDDLRSAAVDFPETPFRALLFGTPPRILNVDDDTGFSGYLDEIVVSGSTPNPSAEPPSQHGRAIATPNKRSTSAVEVGARRHLDMILEAQRKGGWGPLVALPSGLHFLSAPALLPYGDRFYFGKGRASSVVVAIILLRSYEVLGDPRYLEAARSIGDRLLELQNEFGTWPGQALLANEGSSVRQNSKYAILNDRIQTMPVLLLWRLHAMTGDERFASAAARGVEFLKQAQNSTGSWPNRVVLASGRRESMSGLEGAGETNDFGTSDAMNIMLVMYRRTGDVEYLARFLGGANWLARVFQDGRAKGWAQQYDAKDCPIEARHHEPAAVAFREMDDVPRTLLEAYLLTGSKRYREVLKRWANYVRSVEDAEGWFPYYDIDTGKPIRHVGGRRVAADPRERRDYGVTKVLKRVDQAFKSDGRLAVFPRDPIENSKRLHRRAVVALESMDSRFGTWLSTSGPQGPVMRPASRRLLIMLQALSDWREASYAQDSRWVWRDEDWNDEFGHVMPSAVRFSRLGPEYPAAAKLAEQMFNAGTATGRSACSSENRDVVDD